MAGMLEGVAVLKCSSQTQVKTAQDMQREVWNSSPSSVLKVSVMAGMLEGVAVLKCSSQTQVQTTAGAQSKAINTITYIQTFQLVLAQTRVPVLGTRKA